MGQLGLGENVLERKKPAVVTLPEGIVQAVAGGMHTVCLSNTGNVRFFKTSYATMIYGSNLLSFILK